jgi:hypothetical protein
LIINSKGQGVANNLKGPDVGKGVSWDFGEVMIDLVVGRAVEINLFKVDNRWSEGVLRVGVLVVSVSGKL